MGPRRSRTPRSSCEGDAFTWVGKQGQRQPPQGATRVDLSGKTVMPSLIDGHNHIGLVNEKDGSNSKANYRRENLVDQLERYAYYGVAAALSMGLEADQELAYELRDQVIPNAARFLTVGKGIAATPIGGPTGEPRLGIPYGARTATEGRDHVRELHARGVRFVKIWVDDRNGDVPKLQPSVYRAIIAEAHGNGMEVLAHLSRTSALADAKDLLRAGVDGFVHLVRDRDVDSEYLAAVKAHPKVWSGPNIPVPSTRDTIASLAETLPANQIENLRAQLAQLEAKGNPPNELFELHCRNLRKIHDAGMVIGMGTDGTGDGFGAHEQIEAYTRCGMTRDGGHRRRDGNQREDSPSGSDGNRCGGERGQLQRAGCEPSGEHHEHTAYLQGLPERKGTRSASAQGQVHDRETLACDFLTCSQRRSCSPRL